MLISDVLRTKGYDVVRIHPTDSVELAVRKLAENRIGALVVEDRWMKPIGVFSERDFICARPSCSCRMVVGISGAGGPTALVMPASVITGSVASSEELQS
jgi:CBS domain-containing protein